MPDGFSEDGYISDQDYFSAYPYRTMTSDINGCGWIAAYNFRRALGQAAGFDEVRREMDGMFALRLPGPTTMRVMLRYLQKYVPECRCSRGREAALAAAARSRAGILRYREENVPHFVTYISLGGGRCRFLNVADGLEDFVQPLADFVRGHCAGSTLLAITAE